MKQNLVVLDARTANARFPGVGRYVSGLAWGFRALGGRGPALALLSPRHATGAYGLPDFRLLRCDMTPFSLASQWVIPSLLNRSGAALYHSPYYFMPFRPGIPSVITLHDAIPVLFPRYFTRAQRIIYRATHFLAARTASAIIAVSESTRGDVIRCFKVAPEMVSVIPEAAGRGFERKGPGEVGLIRSRYGLPERYVLYVGTNKPHKNLERLVRAWSLARKDCAGAPEALVIAGHWDSRYAGPVKVAGRSGVKHSVVFAGTVSDEDLPALYSGASLFVFPSLYEGFGLPVLEAMACGTPVACSATGSLREVAGEAAATFHPEDVGEMAQTIARLLADPDRLAALGEAGRARAASFSWEKSAAETAKIYEKALAGRGR